MSEAQSRQAVATPAAVPLDAELDRIHALRLDELRALWRGLTRQNPPKALSRDLMARMLAYRIQEQTIGKLSHETRKLLDRLARGEGEQVRHLKVGTVMVREHQGILHEVMVVPGGFSWREQTYASLSIVARAITGTSWNGGLPDARACRVLCPIKRPPLGGLFVEQPPGTVPRQAHSWPGRY